MKSQSVKVPSHTSHSNIACGIYICIVVLLLPFIANCGDLPHPTNGEVVLNGTNLTSVAVYTCRMGYELVGTEVRICQGNGLWSGGEPSCISM